MKKKTENIDEALLKVALGYQIAEVTEEYAETNGELKLVKRKKTKKDVPPDLKAVQMLLAGSSKGEYAAFSDEELEEEKQRLLAQLQEKDGGRVALNSKKATGTTRKTVRKTARKTAKKTTKKTEKKTEKKPTEKSAKE